MRISQAISIAAVLLSAACSKRPGSSDAPGTPAFTSQAHVASHPALQWVQAPPVLPPGAEIAVLEGDPTKAEPFTVRLRFPNGYKIPPHTHPTAENVTVLTGTFLAGMGTRFVESNMQQLGRDDFASIPANHPHYAMTRGQTVVQVHALGPFALTYVNPADVVAR